MWFTNDERKWTHLHAVNFYRSKTLSLCLGRVCVCVFGERVCVCVCVCLGSVHARVLP